MVSAQELISYEDTWGANNYKPLDVVLTRGEGVWVYDVDGNKYLDFLAAYSALNQGYCHPRLVKVMQEQAARLTLTSRAFRNDQLPLFEKELCSLLGFEKMLPMNSGAEAVETVIKLARKWGYRVKGVPDGRAHIIACDGNFHGRTTTIVGFSSEEQYKDGFGPFTPGFSRIPYGDVAALEAAITDDTVAFLVEPLQGEAGIVVAPDGYLRAVRELCTEKNVLLIADEIQSGLGRTGRMLCCDHEGVKPDVLTLGKALSGGMYPVSAALSSRAIMDMFEPGDHGSTFGGNPLGSAVAREAVKIIVDEDLCGRAAELGEYLMGRLREIESPYVETVRGKGLWAGIVLKQDAGGARRFCEALMRLGVLAKETHETVIRLAPPLVIKKTEVDWALEHITRVLSADVPEEIGAL
ncbi:MAG: ornithine--oxo-acid transaminase [Candidatus Zixiibacteriota bacterium]|jgi:ornithine--oxo-acid transaminase